MDPLKFEIRVTLYAPDPLPALRLLDRPGIAVCDVVRTIALLPERVREMQPHAVYLAEPVAQEILDAIARLCPAHPPRIAAGNVAELLDFTGCAPLALPSLPNRVARAEALLTGLGMSPRLKGYAMLAQGAAMLSTLPPPLPPLQYGLYPLLARQHGISADAVERRMRSAIESAWLHGDWAAQNELMGLSVSAERGKPSCSTPTDATPISPGRLRPAHNHSPASPWAAACCPGPGRHRAGRPPDPPGYDSQSSRACRPPGS